MVNLKNTSAKFLVMNIVRKVIVIVGCLLCVFSFIYPFFHVSLLSPGGGYSIYYRSYESEYHIIRSVPIYYWFYDYWFRLFVGLGMPWVFISLFTVQILTLVFGVTFTISNRRTLSFEPVIFSIATLLLMSYIGERINEVLPGLEYPYISYSSQYQLGYYLVYPSVVLFACAFALNEVAKKRQTSAR